MAEDFNIRIASPRKPARRRNIVVSFDYDGTTVFPIEPIEYDEDGEAVSELNPEAEELMRMHASQGDKVVIVTCRPPDAIGSVWKMVKDNGLPVEEVYATAHTDKSPTLISIGASIHYDDSSFRINEIRRAMGPAIKVYYTHEMSENLNAGGGS